MAGAVPWHVTASCQARDLDALVAMCDNHADTQYEGDGADEGEGLVSVRFLTSSPTMTGVKTEAHAAVMRRLGSVIDSADVLTLFREADSAVFDAAGI